MKEVNIFVPGPVMGKMRARTVRNGNFTRTFTPQKNVIYENFVKEIFLDSGGERFPDETPLEMIITAYFEVPRSYSKKKTAAALKNEMWPVKKPDADNIAKIICDALNGIAYRDDTQIISLKVLKIYDKGSGVQVNIKELELPFT